MSISLDIADAAVQAMPEEGRSLGLPARPSKGWGSALFLAEL